MHTLNLTSSDWDECFGCRRRERWRRNEPYKRKPYAPPRYNRRRNERGAKLRPPCARNVRGESSKRPSEGLASEVEESLIEWPVGEL